MKKLFSFSNNQCRFFNALFVAIFLVFCGFVLFSFITVPFTGDLQVFMAAANQVKYQDSSGIMAVFEAWELKGIGNRLLMWIIYVIADLIVGYEKKIAFSYAAKSVYAVFAILMIGGTAYLWPTKDIKHKYYSFFAMFLAIFATFTSVQMQAEMTCVIISLFCTACILHGKKWSLIVSGILAATLMFYKSIFVLFFAVIVLGVMMYDTGSYEKKKDYWLTIGSMMVAEVLLLAATFIVYPQEFVDMKLSASLQSTLLSGGSDVKLPVVIDRFVDQLTMTSVAIPLLVAGGGGTILLASSLCKEKDYGRVGLLFLIWLIPVDLIVLSNMYFQYHYYMLMLPGLISIITLLKYEDISNLTVFSAAVLGAAVVLVNKIVHIVNASLIMLVLVHVLLLAVVVGFAVKNKTIKTLFQIFVLGVCIFFWCNYSSCISGKYKNLVALQNQAVDICDNTFPQDFGDEPVLFLDAGSAPYYVDAPSYSRYFFNLPMQRWSPGADWPIQANEYEKMLEYDGKYILHTAWFGIEKYPELVEKLNNEYEILSDSGLYFHSPDWNLLEFVGVPDIDDIHKNSSTFLYVRKDA